MMGSACSAGSSGSGCITGVIGPPRSESSGWLGTPVVSVRSALECTNASVCASVSVHMPGTPSLMCALLPASIHVCVQASECVCETIPSGMTPSRISAAFLRRFMMYMMPTVTSSVTYAVRVRARACACACVRLRVRSHAHVFAHACIRVRGHDTATAAQMRRASSDADL